MRAGLIKNRRDLFASPIMRAFREKPANSRQSIYVEGATEASLADVADQIWRECHAALACSGDNEPIPAGNQSLAADDASCAFVIRVLSGPTWVLPGGR